MKSGVRELALWSPGNLIQKVLKPARKGTMRSRMTTGIRPPSGRFFSFRQRSPPRPQETIHKLVGRFEAIAFPPLKNNVAKTPAGTQCWFLALGFLFGRKEIQMKFWKRALIGFCFMFLVSLATAAMGKTLADLGGLVLMVLMVIGFWGIPSLIAKLRN